MTQLYSVSKPLQLRVALRNFDGLESVESAPSSVAHALLCAHSLISRKFIAAGAVARLQDHQCLSDQRQRFEAQSRALSFPASPKSEVVDLARDISL